MDRSELIQIPITDLLSHLGYEPVKKTKGGTQWMYHSPLREERTPSFSVSTQKNLWNDLGLDKGGNVIDLAIALNSNCTYHKAATWLEEQYRAFGNGSIETRQSRYLSFLNPKRPTAEDMRDVRVIPLAHHALLSYLMSRGIPIEVGAKYCQEVHYNIYTREYYGLCFPNIVGGMEIRNIYFKGCYGVKAPSVIPIEKHKRTETCCVFEGFMDFLSYITLSVAGCSDVIQPEPCDCIVLNSTSIVRKALPFIKVYQQAYCYLDNDASGETAYLEIKDAMNGNAKSCCAAYANYNDLNDYLNGKMKRAP